MSGFYAAGHRSFSGPSGLGGPAMLAAAAPWWLALGLGLHWITLRNRRRVLIDRQGRIAAGLPAEFSGVNVRDISPLSRSLRQIDTEAADCEIPATGARTFRTADGAAAELVDANPSLAELLETDCSHDCQRYRAWVRRGRRGPKPLAGPGDGRFDALNERLDLKGKRRVSSWIEAVHVTVPPSRRWQDFADRLPALEEATGLSLNLPPQAEALHVDAEAREACRDRADQAAADLVDRARAGRLADSEEVPF